MNYLQLLTDSFAAVKEWDNCCETRLQYLSSYIFDFTTYDGAMDELLATKAVEVCQAISNKATFDRDDEGHRWFIIMVNMPFFQGRLEWGTSIRGAWWAYDPMELDSTGVFQVGEQVGPLHFTREEWLEFIAALIEFARG